MCVLLSQVDQNPLSSNSSSSTRVQAFPGKKRSLQCKQIYVFFLHTPTFFVYIPSQTQPQVCLCTNGSKVEQMFFLLSVLPSGSTGEARGRNHRGGGGCRTKPWEKLLNTAKDGDLDWVTFDMLRTHTECIQCCRCVQTYVEIAVKWRYYLEIYSGAWNFVITIF